MIAFVVPPALVLTGILVVPLAGSRVAASFALVTVVAVTLLIEVVSLTVDFIPFTRAYQPGHAKLRTRWLIYVAGVYAFAYWPARFQLWWRERPDRLLEIASVGLLVVMVFELVGRRRATRWSLDPPDDASNDLSSTIALDIGMVQRSAG